MIDANDTLEERNVQIVSSDSNNIILAAGITPGERVATSPLRGAGNGDKVAPTDPLNDTPDRSPSDTTIDNVAEATTAGGASQ